MEKRKYKARPGIEPKTFALSQTRGEGKDHILTDQVGGGGDGGGGGWAEVH